MEIVYYQLSAIICLCFLALILKKNFLSMALASFVLVLSLALFSLLATFHTGHRGGVVFAIIIIFTLVVEWALILAYFKQIKNDRGNIFK